MMSVDAIKTKDEKENTHLPYNPHEETPYILKIDKGVGDRIERLKEGGVVFYPRKSSPLASEKIIIPRENIFDLVPPTIYGLLDDLIPGSSLMEAFLEEMRKFESASKKHDQDLSYGILAYYSRKQHLVRFAPRFWHRLALLVRNSTLFQDADMKMEWKEIRTAFEGAVIAVAGCSLGNRVLPIYVYILL